METAPFTPTDSAHAPLKRELGLPTATALVVGNMIGSGIFPLPPSLAAVAIVSGSGSLLAWALTGIGAMHRTGPSGVGSSLAQRPGFSSGVLKGH